MLIYSTFGRHQKHLCKQEHTFNEMSGTRSLFIPFATVPTLYNNIATSNESLTAFKHFYSKLEATFMRK